MKRRSHKNQRDRLTNAERADKYLRDVFPDRNKLVAQFAAAGRAAVARFKRRHGL
jgi:DNA-binding phage protein